MKVKDIIICALNNLGRSELAEAVSAGTVSEGADAETVNTLLYCFNAVEDEVARCYMPLIARQTLTSESGQFPYTIFLNTPVRIRRVLAGGKDIEYRLFPMYLQTDAKSVTVEYEYSPAKKTLTGYSDYEKGEIGEYMFACGIAAEFCLINGEIEAAETWESRYRQEIDAVRKRCIPAAGYIPPRRWV